MKQRTREVFKQSFLSLEWVARMAGQRGKSIDNQFNAWSPLLNQTPEKNRRANIVKESNQTDFYASKKMLSQHCRCNAPPPPAEYAPRFPKGFRMTKEVGF